MSVIGLRNLGNTCFMNSALQVLLNCHKLNDAILESDTKGEIIDTYRQLVKDYRESDRTIAPRGIKSIIAKHTGLFSGFGQEDSHEFLALLLTRMEREFKDSNKKDNTIGSLVDSKIRVTLRSIESKLKSCHDEQQTIVELDLPNRDRDTSLSECIQNFISLDPIDGKAKFEVGKGDEKREIEEKAVKYYAIANTSKYLIFHLKRFTGTFRKKNNSVKSPERMETTKGVYNLKSFIVQSGSLGGGHYVSYVKENNIWRCANDSIVSNVIRNNIKSEVQNAYVLCYERED